MNAHEAAHQLRLFADEARELQLDEWDKLHDFNRRVKILFTRVFGPKNLYVSYLDEIEFKPKFVMLVPVTKEQAEEQGRRSLKRRKDIWDAGVVETVKILNLATEEVESWGLPHDSSKGDTIIMGPKYDGDHYENTGQAGALGPYAKAEGNTFIQMTKQALDEKPLTNDDLSKLQELITRLSALAGKEVKGNEGAVVQVPQQEAFQAIGHLSGLLAAKDTHEQAQHLSTWRQWLKDNGEKIWKPLGIIADTIGITLPLLKLLGVPVP